MWWNDCVFERTEEHRRCSGKGTSFSVYVCKKNLFYYKEILHYATLRSEWQSSVSESRIKNPRHQIIVLNAKFFYSHYVLRKQSWRNSFASKRGGNWCDDVVMWWCGYVVMRWKPRIKNMRHWVLCKTTAPKENATVTETIFFSPTLKGGKLFIVSCEFWFFLYTKFFLFSLCFKEAKLAKFIRFEAGGNWCGDVVMWWCDDVVMRWRSRIKNMRHWVLCKTTAPKDNTTLTQIPQ